MQTPHTDPTPDKPADRRNGDSAAHDKCATQSSAFSSRQHVAQSGAFSNRQHAAQSAPSSPASTGTGGNGAVPVTPQGALSGNSQTAQASPKTARTRSRSRRQPHTRRRSKPVTPWQTDSLYPPALFPLPERKRLSLAALALTLLFNLGILWLFFVSPENNPLLPTPSPTEKLPQKIRFIPPFVQTNPAANQEKIDTIQEGAQNQRAAQEADPDPSSHAEGPQLDGEDPRFNRIISGNPLAADTPAPAPTETDPASDSAAPQAAGAPSAASTGSAGATASPANPARAPSQRRGHADATAKPVAVLPAATRSTAAQAQPKTANIQPAPTPATAVDAPPQPLQQQPTVANARSTVADAKPPAEAKTLNAAETESQRQPDTATAQAKQPEHPPAAAPSAQAESLPVAAAQTTEPTPETETGIPQPTQPAEPTTQAKTPEPPTPTEPAEPATQAKTPEPPTPAEPAELVTQTETIQPPAEVPAAEPAETQPPAQTQAAEPAAMAETPPSPLAPTPEAAEATPVEDLPVQVLIPVEEQTAPPTEEPELAETTSPATPAQQAAAAPASGSAKGAAEGIDPQRPRPRPTLEPRVSAGPLRQQAAAASRRGVVAIDSKFSEFGAYQQRMVEAISQQWYLLAGQSRAIDSEYGTKVVLRFKMNDRGIVSSTEVLSTSASVAATLLCINAVESRSPFGAWNSAMKRTLGDEQTITFTFYYR